MTGSFAGGALALMVLGAFASLTWFGRFVWEHAHTQLSADAQRLLSPGGFDVPMPTALRRRLVASLLVVGGAVLFGLGAGGLGGVDARLETAVQAQPQLRPPAPRFDVRGDRPRRHREAF